LWEDVIRSWRAVVSVGVVSRVHEVQRTRMLLEMMEWGWMEVVVGCVSVEGDRLIGPHEWLGCCSAYGKTATRVLRGSSASWALRPLTSDIG
jgi:hypothetical protein